MHRLLAVINRPKWFAHACITLLVAPLFLQGQTGGFLHGEVHDRSGFVLPGAEVRIQNEATGARQKIESDAEGKYDSAPLAPGLYRITVRRSGFRTVAQSGISVQPGRTRALDFLLDILPMQQEVTVEAHRDSSDPNAGGLTVSRTSPQSTLPVNGRDLQALYPLLPGAITTPAPTSDGGQLSVTGQRPTMNSYRIDGISGNTSIGIVSSVGPFPGATLPGMTTIGSTQSLASREETQRVDLKPFNFAAERGERPGAQIDVETRSGSNELHGSALGYLRPGLLNSDNWFAQNYSLNIAKPSLRGWAGSLGGPVIPNRTFFFGTLEQTSVRDSALHLLPTPSLIARASASSAYQPFLNAFPAPFGPALNSTEALGAGTLRKDGWVSSTSLRLDQTIGSKLQAFARAAYVPSSSVTTDLGSSIARFRWFSGTVGFNLALGSVIQQFRANFSQVSAQSDHVTGATEDQPGIAAIKRDFYTTLYTSSYSPYYYVPYASLTALSLAGVGQIVSGPSGLGRQAQWEGTYNMSLLKGRHEFRVGVDYSNLHPSPGFSNEALSLVAQSTAALLAGNPLTVTLNAPALPYTSIGIQTISTFVQDTFHVADNLTVLYGMRQEITPFASRAINPFEGYFPYAGYWSGPGFVQTLVGQPVPPSPISWATKYTQLAPRLGIAYHWKAPDLILRVGAGTFYDTGFSSAINAGRANALGSWQFFPLGGAATLPTGVPEAPTLNIPRVLEWRTSLEKTIRSHSALSLSYIGSAGRSLLRQEASLDPQTSLLRQVYFTNNSRSDYQALQAQFTGNLTPHLYTLISYTWGHSLDTGSRDNTVFLTYPGYRDAVDRGSSNFDIRHALTVSLQYRLPAPNTNRFLHALLHNWIAGATLQARTGFPFDVTTIDRSIGLGFDNTGRPDLVPGVPLWLANSAVPGGRQLNPAAFRTPAHAVSGTLGRNVLTGPGLFQIDATLHRQWRLSHGLLEANLAAFNLPNRATFANPLSYTGSALFGQSVSMANFMLGSGTPTTGQIPLFQAGGARTVEVGLKISF